MTINFQIHDSVKDPSIHYAGIESAIQCAEQTLSYGVYSKSQNIPIYFVSEKTIDAEKKMIKDHFLDLLKDLRENGLSEESSFVWEPCFSIDFLGLYLPKGKINKNGSPEIWICFDKIKENEKSREFLITLKVVIHELGHAIMDALSNVGRDDLKPWIEEALANKIALDYLSKANNVSPDNFAFAKQMIEQQPINYAMGLNIFDFEHQKYLFDWREWKNSKSFLNNKEREMKKWRDLVIQNVRSSNGVCARDFSECYKEIVTPPSNTNALSSKQNRSNSSANSTAGTITRTSSKNPMFVEQLFKTLSRNDSGKISNVSGILIPKMVSRSSVFPDLPDGQLNPRCDLDFVDEKGVEWNFQYIYYNSKHHGNLKGHDDFRLTCTNKYLVTYGVTTGDQVWFAITPSGERRIGFVKANQQQANPINKYPKVNGVTVIKIKSWTSVKF